MPAVVISDSEFRGIGGAGDSAVKLEALGGGVVLERISLVDTDMGIAAAELVSIDTAAVSDEAALTMTDIRCVRNGASTSTLRISGVTGSVAISNLSIIDSRADISQLWIEYIFPNSEGVPSTVTVADSEISGARPYASSRSPENGLMVRASVADLVLSGTAVTDVAARDSAAGFTWVFGAVLVQDCHFAENTATGLAIEEATLLPDDQVLITGSTFLNNTSDRDAGTGGLSISSARDEGGATPIVEVRNSSFLGNVGELAGGVYVSATNYGGADQTEAVFEGDTFWNPEGGNAQFMVGASDVYFSSPHASGEASRQLIVRNSTLERRDDTRPEVPGVYIGEGGSHSELEHVSMPGAMLFLADANNAVTLRNSVLGPASDAAVQGSEQARVEGTGNLVPVLGGLPRGVADTLPLSDWKLGQLADNGGPTLTLMPAAGPPLVDTAGARYPIVDQRGVARPQGPKADRGSVERVVIAQGVIEVVAEDREVTVVAGETAKIRVQRVAPAAGLAQVSVVLRDGTAIAGTDYLAKRSELSWNADEARAQDVDIPTMGRGSRGTRTFTAELVDAEGASIGALGAATVTVTEEAPGGGGGGEGPGGGTDGPGASTGPETHHGRGAASGPLASTGDAARWAAGLAVLALMLAIGGGASVARVRGRRRDGG